MKADWKDISIAPKDTWLLTVIRGYSPTRYKYITTNVYEEWCPINHKFDEKLFLMWEMKTIVITRHIGTIYQKGQNNAPHLS